MSSSWGDGRRGRGDDELGLVRGYEPAARQDREAKRHSAHPAREVTNVTAQMAEAHNTP